MKVLHAPVSIAGFPSLMVGELRALGFEAESWAPGVDYLGWRPDRVFENTAHGRASAVLEAARWLGPDGILHLSFGESFLSEHADLHVLRPLVGRVFVSFFGSDARLASLAREQCPTCVSKMPDAAVEARLRSLAKHDVIPIAHEYRLAVGLARFFRAVMVAPVGIDLARHPTDWRPRGERVRVAHAPTWPEGKGSAHVLAAVQRLQQEGLPVDLDVIQGASHDECRARMAAADIVVDQLLDGSPGTVTYEALHSGRAVVVNTCGVYLDAMPEGGPPVHHATPETVLEVLRGLCTSSTLGEPGPGPDWVRRHHDHRALARVLARLYRGEARIPICGIRPLWPEVYRAAERLEYEDMLPKHLSRPIGDVQIELDRRL